MANLPANIDESALGNFFAQKCGPVGSVSAKFTFSNTLVQRVSQVKIMWPRGDAAQGPGADMTTSRARKSSGLSGFVSFMKRKDAETAVREMDGFSWGGSVLRVGWGKAVPIAAKAAYVGEVHCSS